MNRTAPLALGLMLLAGVQTARADEPATIRIRYIVKDVTPAVAFYTGKLGFKLEMQSGPYFAALSRGGVQLLLSPQKGIGGASQPMPSGERPSPGGWNRMVIYVNDLPAKVAELRQAGVHFRNEIVNGPGGSEILLEDPSGNPVELFQPY